MKQNKIDTVVIVDGKPMWKKDWEKQEKENMQEYYCAVVLPSEYSFGGYRENEIVYIVKVTWDGKKTNKTFLPKGCVIGESDFTNFTVLSGKVITNSFIDNKDFSFITAQLDYDEITDDILEFDDYNFIDIRKTFKKVNNIENHIKYDVVEELYAQEFQENKCSEERNEWLDENGADEGYWVDYVEEDIQEYVDKLNNSMTSVNKLQKELQKKQIKEYKLVEV